MERNILSMAIRSAIVLTTTAVLGSGTAMAQTDTSQDSELMEEVYVTGSRIQRSNLDSPTPITVLGVEDIAGTGTTNIGELLEKLPSSIAFSNQSNSTFSSTSAGLNTTALRNLGQERTLVLVNGRRFVSGVNPGSGYAVDLSSIPTAIIDHIEVLTGGQSAVYGSDAVAGVVNIITKKDFEGVEINVRNGVSAEGDHEESDVDITLGGSWDKGNAWASFGYSDENGIMARDRSFSDTDIIAYDSDGDGLADSHNWLGSSFLPQGRFGDYQGDGTPFRSGIFDRENSDRFNRADFRQLLIPIERRYAASGITYNFDEKLTVNLQTGYNETFIASNIEPVPLDLSTDIWNTGTVVGGTGGHDIASSLLLPTLLRDNLLADGFADLNQVGNNVTARRLVEFGSRGAEADRSTLHASLDATYDFGDGWVLNTFGTWGKTRTIMKSNGNFNVERALFALDVELGPDNKLRCVDASARAAGCAPFNPFGLNTISPEAVSYLSASTTFRAEVEQTVFGASVSGELPVELPGGAIGIAGGIEYREEKGSETPSGFVQSGIISGNAIAPTDGEFDVTDYFIEARFPVLDQLIVEAAYRSGDYSTVGVQDTWKLGLDAPVLDSVRLRATISTSVRAPNISDLFAGAGETFATVQDICEGVTASSTGVADGNCRSIQAIADRIAADGAFTLTQVEKQSTGGLIGGNPNVKEETADSWTAGVVLTPSFIEGLVVAIDWYDIEIDNAIDITTRSTVVERCYTASAAFDPTCGGQVVRDSAGALVSVNSISSNENIIETSGLDLDIAYNVDLESWTSALRGNLNISFLYNFIDKFDTIGIADGDIDEDKGEILWPENRFNLTSTYNYDHLTAIWRVRYWDEVNDSNTPELGDENGFFEPFGSINTIEAKWYHDIQVNYDFTDTLNAYVGAKNLFDEDPGILGQASQWGSTGINTAPEAYDVIGRRYYAGVKYSF